MTDLILTNGEIRNSKLLLILVGILVVPVTNAISSLLFNSYILLGFSLKTTFVLSLSFEVVVILMLVALFLCILKRKPFTRVNFKVELSIHTFKLIGIASLIIIILSTGLNALVGLSTSKPIDFTQIDSIGLEIEDLSNLVLISTGIQITRNVIFFIIYFSLVFRNTKTESSDLNLV